MEGIREKNNAYAPKREDMSRIHSDEGRVALV